jgi:DNA-binding transcriptional LysR family regulator
MNIESLKYFYLIVKKGNISNVAKEVHLTQSALSQQIQRLESDLGKKLLIRSNQGVELTSNGKIVFKFAENMLRIHEKMMLELEEAEKASTIIKIQACSSTADYALPCTLITANAVYPNHHYELSSYASSEILSNVNNNICDIGFSCVPKSEIVGNPDLIIEKVGENKIVLVSKNDSIYPEQMSLDNLLGSCLITFTEKNNITNTLSRNLNKLGYDQKNLKCNLRVEGIESAKILVHKNYGIAFLPYISVKGELYKKLFKTIKAPELHMDLDIIMVYKKNCSGHVKDFVLWFKKYGSKSFC